MPNLIKVSCECGNKGEVKPYRKFLKNLKAVCICGKEMKVEIVKINIWTKFLILLGLRCPKCGGKLYQPYGWHFTCCEKCEEKV